RPEYLAPARTAEADGSDGDDPAVVNGEDGEDPEDECPDNHEEEDDEQHNGPCGGMLA
ncbi:MAG: hypothetical protein Q9218_003349, partial [Villophora microphyllina]